MYNNIILTGVPRSGTTLACTLLNNFHNTISLMEPMDPHALDGDANKAIAQITKFVFESRMKISTQKKMLTHNQNGVVPTNPLSDKVTPGTLRECIVSRGEIALTKELEKDFSLVIKHNALFAALLDKLCYLYRCVAIVRNPLSTLLSWNTVDLPVYHGHIPAAEKFDNELKKNLEVTECRYERQIIILNWFFTRFDRYIEKQDIIKYEDIIEDDAKALGGVSYDGKQSSMQKHTNKNNNALYKSVDVSTLYEKLLESQGAFWKYYDLSDLKEMYEMQKGKR